MQQPVGVAIAPDVVGPQTGIPSADRLGGEMNQRHFTQWLNVVVPQRLVSNSGARLDVSLFDPRIGVVGEGDVLGHHLGNPLLRRGPLPPFDHAALVGQPVLSVHACREGLGRVVADQVGADV